jgi:hypothetical protein
LQDGANSSAQLDELEREVDQLSNRAAAVNSGLDRLQQEQGAAGYGLRGDMVARQASMKANLFKAEEAIQHRDVARTKKYVDLAGGDVEALERFLGHWLTRGTGSQKISPATEFRPWLSVVIHQAPAEAIFLKPTIEKHLVQVGGYYFFAQLVCFRTQGRNLETSQRGNQGLENTVWAHLAVSIWAFDLC